MWRTILKRLYSSDRWHEGASINGFLCRQRHHIPELDTIIIRLKHVSSGANYIHLYSDDPNSVFAIGFKTPPIDSTGTPHILEHLVLCGSEKYPVRDPFFKMLNRTLSNYMNAWTASDHTFYPFSTEHPQDHSNLRDIYFDACFNPSLKLQDFRQEGWRLCPKTKQLKGVVLNEMKGALSDADAIFNEHWQRLVYCNSCYGENSGGDPSIIPSLTYSQLLAFYKQHYTAGNALFVGYGKLIDDNVEYLADKLSTYEPRYGKCPSTRRLNKLPKETVFVDGPMDPMGDPTRQHRTLLAWRCNDLVKSQESFHWQLLSHLLLDGPTAPLYKALIESGLGCEFASGTGYHANATKTSFGVGLEGVKEADLEKVHSVIMDTLNRVVKEGISQERIDSVLHQIQLSLKYKSASFGLNMAASVMAGWTRGIYPVPQLSIHSKVEEFLVRLKRKPVLEPLLKKYIIDCTNRLSLTMRPDEQYNAKLEASERALVEKMIRNMTSEELDELIASNDQLEADQKRKTENIDQILPMLKVSDISSNLKIPNITPLDSDSNISVYSRVTPSANGLVYVKVLKQFDTIPPHPHLLPLALSLFTEFGPTSSSFEEYEEKVKRTCSGFSLSYILKSENDFRLLISAHCLEEKAKKTMDLLTDTLLKVDYTRTQRLKTQIMSTAASLSNSVSSSGHQYALTAALTLLEGDAKFKIKDIFSGLEQAKFMQSLAQVEDLKSVTDKVKEIHEFLIRGPGKIRLTYTACSDQSGLLKTTAAKIFNQKSSVDSCPQPNVQYARYEDVLQFPMNTKYSAAAFKCPSDSYKQKAALILSGELLKSKFLHREIRENGGAYGAGSSYNHIDQVFTFYSYRDPSPERSLQKYKEAIEWLKSADITEKDLDESKLSVISGTDSPKDLGEEGLALFKSDITDAERAELRKKLLAVTPADIKAVCSLLPMEDSDWSKCIIKGT